MTAGEVYGHASSLASGGQVLTITAVVCMSFLILRCAKLGNPGETGFLLTGAVFDFSISALEPNTYDGLLFVTVYERDG